jgi:hypothetical protein
MFGAIPNPKKTITIDFPIEKVKVAARNIDKIMKFCHFREENDMFNSYKFSRSEFLSMGALININLNSISENKTQVDIEISRQLGAFDEWVEVTKAGRHMEEAFNAMSSIIKNGVPKIEPVVTAPAKPATKAQAITSLILLLGFAIGSVWFLIKVINLVK